MIADINSDNLERAKQDLATAGGSVDAVVCNVADIDSVRAAAQATVDRFGKIHLLFNNAGVGLAGKSGQIAIEDWRWIVDINLMGVVHGVEVFTPIMFAQGEGGYILNTASMAGHATMAAMSPYHATKFAVVGYSESIRQELSPLGIDVGVLCPTWIKSNIYNASKDRPSLNGASEDTSDNPVYLMAKNVVDNGLSPDVFAQLVIRSIEAKRFYTFIDETAQPAIDIRRDHIMSDYDACLADLQDLA